MEKLFFMAVLTVATICFYTISARSFAKKKYSESSFLAASANLFNILLLWLSGIIASVLVFIYVCIFYFRKKLKHLKNNQYFEKNYELRIVSRYNRWFWFLFVIPFALISLCYLIYMHWV